jgi:hypothetical protein
MSKYKKVEKEQTFTPIMSDYERFVKQQYGSRMKRIPEMGAKLPPKDDNKEMKIQRALNATQRKETTDRLQKRMNESLEGKKVSAPKATPASKVVEKDEETKRKPRYVPGFEKVKSGKRPGFIEVGKPRPAPSSEKEIEFRKRALKRASSFKR